MKKESGYGLKLVFLVSMVLVVLWLPESSKGANIYPPHSGRAVTSFDDIVPPSDTYIVNDTDSPTLDRYLYRGSGGYDIIIPIKIYRYVGDLNTLLSRNLISKTFHIYIPAYDVDSSTKPQSDCDGDGALDPLNPEKNEVYFNDSLIGVLEGADGSWKLNDAFELDITKLNFPDSPGSIGYNYIGIKIDVANKDVILSSGSVGCKVWATEIDWAGIKFEATSPVVFVPGLSGFAGSFDKSGYQSNLFQQTGIPSEIITHSAFVPSSSACNTTAPPSLTEHAAQMYQTVKDAAEHFGTDSVHLIAHSKGGLDSRFFLRDLKKYPLQVQVGEMGGQPVFSDLTVSSLVTHGSPHLGTVVADKVIASIPFAHYIASDLCDLTTWVMSTVNQTLAYPAGTTTLTIGAEADKNRDGKLDDSEVLGNQVGEYWSNTGYQWLRDIASVRGEYEARIDDPVVTTWVIKEKPTLFPQLNDTMVTGESATNAYGYPLGFIEYGKNHGTIIDTEIQNTVINIGLDDNLLHWRLR